MQSIVAKRQELIQGRAKVSGSDGDGGRVGPEASDKQTQQQDSGDCLVQSVSEMDLIDHEPTLSSKPSPHTTTTQQVTYTLTSPSLT